ncbi:MAG: 5'-3' exonuclease H3TH domain-containing protein [Candidatus Roizmanbacteria bacterium]
MKTLLLIDGSGIMYRAFFALPAFMTKAGIPTNAIYGTLTMVHKVTQDFNTDHVLFCMDTPTPTFRKKLLTTYQSQRPETPKDFIVQIAPIKELLTLGGITCISQPGYEADDVIGTLAHTYKSQFDRVYILSSDKDILQLVDINVSVISPTVGISQVKVYTPTDVEEKMGVLPEKIPDLKGLIGDPSDNYMGAKGIGPKTAINLLSQFGSIDEMYAHLDEIKSEKVKGILQDQKENVTLSQTLATILTDVPLDLDIANTTFQSYRPELKPKLEEYNMKSLLARFFNEKVHAKKTSNESHKKETVEKQKPPDDQIKLF